MCDWGVHVGNVGVCRARETGVGCVIGVCTVGMWVSPLQVPQGVWCLFWVKGRGVGRRQVLFVGVGNVRCTQGARVGSVSEVGGVRLGIHSRGWVK